VGIAAFRAAKAKDVDALAALNDQLNAACVTCHAHYRPNYRPRLPQQQTP
jgi:cytochrome c556